MNSLIQRVAREQSRCIRFRCEPPVDEEPQSEIVINVYHSASAPADPGIRREAERAAILQLWPFFGTFNGATFYRHPSSGAAALNLLPIEKWTALSGCMRESFPDIRGKEWFTTAVAFAEVPHSGNYFALALAGDFSGKVLYLDHDVGEAEVFADNFIDFLTQWLDEPILCIGRTGCYARYTTPNSLVQWLPVESAEGPAEDRPSMPDWIPSPFEYHHPFPRRFGGDPRQKLVPLDPLYRMLLTDQFRHVRLQHPTTEEVVEVCRRIYTRYPLIVYNARVIPDPSPAPANPFLRSYDPGGYN